MPSLVLKNFFRFSSLAVVSAVSILGGPNLALSYQLIPQVLVLHPLTKVTTKTL